MAKDKSPKGGKSARVLLQLIREPENFRAHLDEFEKLNRDFYLDYHEKFLETVDALRPLVKKGDDVALAGRHAALPVPFQEALIEYAVDGGRIGFFEAALAACDGPAKKALKQAVHRLKAKGVTLPEAERKAVFRAAPAEVEGPFAYASTLDGALESVLILAVPTPRGGVKAIQAFLGAARGVFSFHRWDASRGDVRKAVAQIREGGIVTIAPVAVEYVLYLVARARRRIREKNLAAPEGFVSAWNLTIHGMTEPDRHPAWSIAGAAEAAARTEMLNRGDALHDLPEVRMWTMDADTLRRFSLRLQERETSRLVIDDAQSKDYVETLVGRTVEDYFTAETRGLVAGALEDTAYLLDRLERADDAFACLATARALADPETPIAAIPFARRMLTKLIRERPAPPEPASEEKPPSSGIVVP
jgi:hypothetical protein